MADGGAHRDVIRLRNRLGELSRLHHFVNDFCLAARIVSEDSFALSLAIDELVTNSIVYGYDDDAEHEIVVGLSADADTVVIETEDDARPFDPTRAADVDVSADPGDRAIGGLGLHFVRRTMDEMVYERSGDHNRLVMKKRRTR
jgi:anti-sigma regulatory factor (Ser/Thr protein kinase)